MHQERLLGDGAITISSALGILALPSIVMVLYAVSTNSSIGAPFMAGVVPGVMLATMLGMTTWWRARRGGYPRQPRQTWAQRWLGMLH